MFDRIKQLLGFNKDELTVGSGISQLYRDQKVEASDTLTKLLNADTIVLCDDNCQIFGVKANVSVIDIQARKVLSDHWDAPVTITQLVTTAHGRNVTYRVAY